MLVGITYDVEIHYQTIKNIDDLEGVDISSPEENQLLTYDSILGWINKDPPLSNVNASSPANNQVLTYNTIFKFMDTSKFNK